MQNRRGARRSDNQRKLSNVLGMQCLDHKLRKECPREADPKNSTNCQVMATERPQDSGTRNLFVLFCFLDKKAQIANTNEARQLNQNDKQKTKTHTQKKKKTYTKQSRSVNHGSFNTTWMQNSNSSNNNNNKNVNNNKTATHGSSITESTFCQCTKYTG